MNHLHITIVVLFMVWFAYKAFLLLTGKNAQLDSLRAKFKLVDIILGVLILATGGYLIAKLGHPPLYMMVKLGLVLALIPMGIVAINKKIKPMAIVVLLGFVYVFIASQAKSLTLQKADATAQLASGNLIEAGAIIYTNECQRCHGDKGDAMIAGAKNLQVTMLDNAGIKEMVTNGKNTMPAYGDKLSAQEIDAVVAYAASLKK
jgi:mono/diheme cytochrome c family protein